MIIILREIRSFSRFKQKIPCQKLENHAGKAPNIRSNIVINSQNHLFPENKRKILLYS